MELSVEADASRIYRHVQGPRDDWIIDRSSNFVIDCLVFCFMDVIRRQLSLTYHLWNAHRIRSSRGAEVPGGVPNHLFRYSEYHGFREMGKPLNQLYIAEVKRSFMTPAIGWRTRLSEWALETMLERGWPLPMNRHEGSDLYGKFFCIQYDYFQTQQYCSDNCPASYILFICLST